MNDPLSRIPPTFRLIIIVAVSILIVIGVWFYGAKAWNGIGNKVFEWRTGRKLEQVEKQLREAENQKRELEKTLLELKQAKEDLAVATKARQQAEEIFNDSSKTSAEKVAAFKDALRDDPVRTDTTGITTESLCERAKAAGADAAVVSALCPAGQQ